MKKVINDNTIGREEIGSIIDDIPLLESKIKYFISTPPRMSIYINKIYEIINMMRNEIIETDDGGHINLITICDLTDFTVLQQSLVGYGDDIVKITIQPKVVTEIINMIAEEDYHPMEIESIVYILGYYLSLLSTEIEKTGLDGNIELISLIEK